VAQGPRVGAIAAHELHHDTGQARRLVARLVELLPSDGDEQRLATALAGVLDRMERSVDHLLVGDTDRVERSVTRIDEVVGRVAREHDPVGDRVELDVPSLVMSVDTVKLERIVDNLLINALEHAPPGSTVRVSGRFEPGSVILTVADDGPGIPDTLVARLADDDGPEVVNPSGLDVVARFARAHGGRVWVTGPGAHVHVELPTSSRSQESDR
jgi:signal transduction histidine kinase